jgi:hypothetical protein
MPFLIKAKWIKEPVTQSGGCSTTDSHASLFPFHYWRWTDARCSWDAAHHGCNTSTVEFFRRFDEFEPDSIDIAEGCTAGRLRLLVKTKSPDSSLMVVGIESQTGFSHQMRYY